MALTRSRARDLAARAVAESALTDVDGGSETQTEEIESASAVEPREFGSAEAEVPVITEAELLEEHSPDLFVAPTSEGLQRLLEVDSSALRTEQNKDPSLRNNQSDLNEGVARKNVSFYEKGGILYRKYVDHRGVTFDQLVVPQAYRQNLLSLPHGS